MQPTIYQASDHDIDPELIDSDALWVIHRLKNAGYAAYLVGGSVRDLLTKKKPKDYDISTSARPEEIRSLFGRKCLLIGRRFRLAHIRFGRKILEVSTFRAGDTQESGLITHDNEWGSEEEDVLRRDFTINGLYYDPTDHKVIDYVGGWADIHAGILRTIGEPITRFKQDPVRMIRLLKFRARFRFEIETGAKMALLRCLNEISKSSPARVLEELFKMLESGYSAPFFQLMADSGLLKLIFPHLTKALLEEGDRLYPLLLSADSLNQKNPARPIDRGLLASCLLFPLLEQKIEHTYTSKGHVPHLGQIQGIASDLVEKTLLSSYSHFPRKVASTCILAMGNQYRMTPVHGRKQFSPRFLRSRDFPDALLLFRMRAEAKPELIPLFEEWREQFLNIRKQEHHASQE